MFYVLFQVLAGVIKGMKYSVPMRLVRFQCNNSIQLCEDDYPRVFYVLFQELSGVIAKLEYSLSFQSALFLLRRSWRLYLCGSLLVASL